MKDEQNNNPPIYDTIHFETKGVYDSIVVLEEICKEFRLGLEKYWCRPAEEDDWFTNGDYVVAKEKPVMPERYELCYDIPLNKDNRNLVLLTQFIVDGMLQTLGYLEGCWRKDK